MRRTELIIESIKRQVESQIDSSGGGVSDEEILDHLNAAQLNLYSEIVQTVPDILLADSYIDLVADQEAYDLPTDLHLGTSIKGIWYKYGSGVGDYLRIPSSVEYYRDSASVADVPAHYIRKGSTLLLNPVPRSNLTSGIRISYQQKVRKLDIRRGLIESVSKTGQYLNTITLDLTPTLGKDGSTVIAARNMLNKVDKICIVNRAGRSILNNVPIDSYDSTTGIITIGETDDNETYSTTKTGADLNGAYVVVGDYSTTHGDWPDETIERYLLAYSTMCLLRRRGNPDEVQYKIQEMQVIKGDLIASYADPDQEIKLLVPDVGWTGRSDYYGCSAMGASGSINQVSVTAANVGLSGEGLFKDKTGDTLNFYNIDSGTGLVTALDGAFDIVKTSLDINSLTADPTPTSSDYVLEYDVSAGAHKKTLFSSILSAFGLTPPITVPIGGTGATSFTAHSLLLGQGTGALTALGVATNGQLVIGSTGADPVLASLTAPAAGVTITGGAGSITFALSDDLAAVEGLSSTGLTARTAASTWAVRTITAGSGIAVTNGDGVSGNPTIAVATGGLTWTTVSGTSASMAVSNGYVANNAGLVTLTLPSSASVGDTVVVMGLGAGFFKIAQNSGQTVRMGGSSTTTGVGGSLTATKQYQSITLRCLVTDTDWEVTASTETFTIV